MKIYFSPEYTGSTFLNLPANKNILLDCCVADTNALLNLLELHAGIYVKPIPFTERLAKYYQAFKRYMTENPDNILSASFRTTEMGTAKACLAWRDKLVQAGWNGKITGVSPRLDVLAGVEQYYSCMGLPERLQNMLTLLETSCPLPTGSTLILPCKEDLFPPEIARLTRLLKKRGTTVEYTPHTPYKNDNLHNVARWLSRQTDAITIQANDPSLQLLHFEEEQDALAYLATLQDNAFNVWINADNKALDNYLTLAGKPQAGSVTPKSNPPLVQLFTLGLELFTYPRNIHTLLQWLQVPAQPLPSNFRYRLAKTLAENGGIEHPGCKEVISQFINENPKDSAKRQDLINTFLPVPTENGIQTNALRRFIFQLTAWTKTQRALLTEKGALAQVAQLDKLTETLEAVSMLLLDETADLLPFATVESWVKNLYTPTDFVQYQAQAGARFIISSPAQLAASAQRIIWCDFYKNTVADSCFGFLSPQEQDKLTEQGVLIWSPQQESDFRQTMQLQTFTLAQENLTLITCARRGSQKLPACPILNRLKSHFKDENLALITRAGKVSQDFLQTAEILDNSQRVEEIRFRQTNLLDWPQKESATSLDMLIQNPLDYAFTYLARCNDYLDLDAQNTARAKGNVAHDVIARLFEGKTGAEAQEKFEKSYDEVYARTLNEKGMILLLPENKLEEQVFKRDLKTCLQHLADIMQNNGLRAVKCEQGVQHTLGFALQEPDILLHGFIDMHLQDEQGQHVIFDFKWTSGKHHINALRQNTSLQLALYKALLAKETETENIPTAYFLMPAGLLVSTHKWKGINVLHIDPQSRENLVEPLARSYRYRREQIQRGQIEQAEGIEPENIPYCQDTPEKHLFPLETERKDKKDVKAVYKFTKISCFKNTLK